MRLQKYLASMGYGSRRKIEDWIQDKRVKVNGKSIELGYKVKKNDKISLDGKQVISTRINNLINTLFTISQMMRYAPAMIKKKKNRL